MLLDRESAGASVLPSYSCVRVRCWICALTATAAAAVPVLVILSVLPAAHVVVLLRHCLYCLLLQLVQGLQSELAAVVGDQAAFERRFSQEEFEDVVSRWRAKLARAQAGEQLWGRVLAQKPVAV